MSPVSRRKVMAPNAKSMKLSRNMTMRLKIVIAPSDLHHVPSTCAASGRFSARVRIGVSAQVVNEHVNLHEKHWGDVPQALVHHSTDVAGNVQQDASSLRIALHRINRIRGSVRRKQFA